MSIGSSKFLCLNPKVLWLLYGYKQEFRRSDAQPQQPRYNENKNTQLCIFAIIPFLYRLTHNMSYIYTYTQHDQNEHYILRFEKLIKLNDDFIQ